MTAGREAPVYKTLSKVIKVGDSGVILMAREVLLSQLYGLIGTRFYSSRLTYVPPTLFMS